MQASDAAAPAISSQGPCALEVQGLSSGYGDLRVLEDVSLRLAAGTVEVALGRNGVGKSTLLSTIAGLIRAWEGSVRLNGEDVSRHRAHRRARDGIALVQEGKRVFRNLTVLENVVLGAFVCDMRRDERREHAKDLLSRFPMLEGRHDDVAGSLSGGQQQMLAIAQALASRPQILLLDEPSAGLAPMVVVELFSHVRALRDSGMTVLLVEQLADVALGIADHVTVMNNGRVVASGLPDEFRDRAELHEAYFGAAAAPR